MTTRVDIFLDPTCPWCYLGYAAFAKAREAYPKDVLHVSTKPYLINPDLPVEGLEYREYLAHRIGDQEAIANRYAPFLEQGEALGLRIRMDKIEKMPNAVNAARFLWWADQEGKGPAAFKEMARGLWSQGLDISDPDIIGAIAGRIGLDSDAITKRINSDEDIEYVREESKKAMAQGLTGVPAFILGGKFVVAGAQPEETWREIIGEIEEKQRDLANTAQNSPEN